MTRDELINRNKVFVIEVIDLIEKLPNTMAFSVFSRQLIRCASSVGANYRAACRAKSSPDFINKLKIVEEEADESIYFLELIEHIDKGENGNKIKKLIKEAGELLAITVASIRTAKSNNQKSKIKN